MDIPSKKLAEIEEQEFRDRRSRSRVVRHNNPRYSAVKVSVSKQVIFQTKSSMMNYWQTAFNTSEYAEMAFHLLNCLSEASEISNQEEKDRAIAKIIQEQVTSKIAESKRFDQNPCS